MGASVITIAGHNFAESRNKTHIRCESSFKYISVDLSSERVENDSASEQIMKASCILVELWIVMF